MYKANKEDLNFSNSFKLSINRNEYIHGLVGWFEVYFTECHIPVRLSTAPFAKVNYWKQTIFYINANILAHKNEIIKGSIALRR